MTNRKTDSRVSAKDDPRSEDPEPKPARDRSETAAAPDKGVLSRVSWCCLIERYILELSGSPPLSYYDLHNRKETAIFLNSPNHLTDRQLAIPLILKPADLGIVVRAP